MNVLLCPAGLPDVDTAVNRGLPVPNFLSATYSTASFMPDVPYGFTLTFEECIYGALDTLAELLRQVDAGSTRFGLVFAGKQTVYLASCSVCSVQTEITSKGLHALPRAIENVVGVSDIMLLGRPRPLVFPSFMLNPEQLEALSSLDWLVSSQSQLAGRTTSLAFAFLRKAFRNPGSWVTVFDHDPGTASATREVMFPVVEQLLAKAGAEGLVSYNRKTLSFKISAVDGMSDKDALVFEAARQFFFPEIRQ